MSRATDHARHLATLLATLLTGSLGADTAAQHKARDRTVGACTRKAEFHKRLAAIDPRIAALVQADPADQPALGRQIAADHGRGQDIECLIRYRTPAMHHVFTALLDEPHWPTVARALYGLKMLGDGAATAAVAGCLGNPDPRLREMAANCLERIGTDCLPALRKALATERDACVRASLTAAIAVQEAGSKPYRDWQERRDGPAEAPRVAWDWTVQGKRSFNDYDAKTLEYPVAQSFGWPISWYEGSLFTGFPRQSFGGKSGHTGEDMAWFREGCSVYAVADGLVRMVQGAGGNWGFLVLVEHRLADGRYVCSLYGHLGWDVLVRSGDVVAKGQKLGTVGLSCSVENGGYGAHLHFGIANGPFRKPRRIYTDGTALNFDYQGKRVKAPVTGYLYMPKKPDQNGFPGLGLQVRMPDGKVLEVHVGNVPMAHQVSWITGYLKGCRGWFEPYRFLRERLAPPAAKRAAEPPPKKRSR